MSRGNRAAASRSALARVRRHTPPRHIPIFAETAATFGTSTSVFDKGSAPLPFRQRIPAYSLWSARAYSHVRRAAVPVRVSHLSSLLSGCGQSDKERRDPFG